MESSTGPLQPTRRAPPPPRLSSSSSRPAVATTASKSTTRRAAGTPPPTPPSSTPVPAPRAKLSQSLSMPFVRRQTQNHVNGRKKAPPPRPPPPKVSLPGNRLKNSVQDNNIGGKDNDAVLIDLSPTPSSSTTSLHVNTRNSDQQQFSLLDAPISSYEPVVSGNHGSNGHTNPDPFGSIEEDNLTFNTFSLNQGINCGSNGQVSSTVEFPSHNSYNSLNLDSSAPTTIDWSSAKRASVSTSSDAFSSQKSQFYTDAPRGTTKKKPTIIKPKNVTVSCVAPSQAKDYDTDLGGATSRPSNSVQKSLTSYAIAEFDYQSSEAGDLCFQAGDTIEDVTAVNGEWLEGRLRGAKGIFPASFVKVMDSVEAERRGLGGRSPARAAADTTALYDFHAEMPTDLPLKEGQVVTVTARVEGGQWLLGHSGGRTGQFPANFVAFVPPNLPVVTL